MKASTFFALTFAVLLGLAGFVAARYFLLRNVVAPAPPPVVVAPQVPQILVAKKNLYEGYAMLPTDVVVRPLRQDEVADYKANQAKYLPANIEAASLRVMTRHLEADKPILHEYLEPQGVPEGLALRLAPKMRAVHVSVPKDRASGGVIRLGEYVDVLLTTTISADNSGKNTSSRTASIARNLRVILKRDMLWTVLAAVPEDKPLAFTLEANPYRAALIEFARDRGHLTLLPTPTPPLAKDAKLGAPKTFSEAGSKEYQNEDERVAAILAGDRTVGDADLERIFGLLPMPVRPAPLRVEMMSGNKVKSVNEYPTSEATADRPPVNLDQPSYGYHFNVPPSPVADAPKTPVTPRPLLKK